MLDPATRLQDLPERQGEPPWVSPNPQIGQVPLPARGVLAIGQGASEILDSNGVRP